MSVLLLVFLECEERDLRDEKVTRKRGLGLSVVRQRLWIICALHFLEPSFLISKLSCLEFEQIMRGISNNLRHENRFASCNTYEKLCQACPDYSFDQLMRHKKLLNCVQKNLLKLSTCDKWKLVDNFYFLFEWSTSQIHHWPLAKRPCIAARKDDKKKSQNAKTATTFLVKEQKSVKNESTHPLFFGECGFSCMSGKSLKSYKVSNNLWGIWDLFF